MFVMEKFDWVWNMVKFGKTVCGDGKLNNIVLFVYGFYSRFLAFGLVVVFIRNLIYFTF